MNKIRIYGEAVYLLATVLLALSVAMVAAADFGISMVVAPAYLLSLRFDFLTFGQAEYVVQGVLFVAFCVAMRRFLFSYLFAFLSCLLYGLILDLWRLIPVFNPAVTPPGSMPLYLRIIFFVAGELLTTFAVALHFKAYIPPQVNDYFVKGLSARYGVKQSVFKSCFDAGCLVVGLILSFCFFGTLKGIGWGTLVITLINGTLIGLFSRLFDRFFTPVPLFPRLKEYFDR